jgi:glycosyltransferase involved in cell wall biosynthesis
MSDNLPLTVLIITHRADSRLAQALASVSFAQEILVIDNNSGQDWSVFTHLALKVIKHESKINDFSAVKNKYAAQAKFDWILFLDSDEQVSSSLANEIKRAISGHAIAGYYLHRVDYFTSQPLHYGEVGQVWLLRLIQKSAVKFSRPVHEYAEVKGQTKKLQAELRHDAHQSINEFYRKIIVYAYLEADFRFKAGKKFSSWEMIIYPIVKFKWNYFVKLGFLDGGRGLLYAVMMSLHSFFVRVRLYELTHNLND